MEIYTAGFAGWRARDFFESLKSHGITRLLDVRLRNTSQLSGFAKRDDLAYFLETIVGASYEHEPMLAPTSEILDLYKKGTISWPEYNVRFEQLLDERQVASTLDPSTFVMPTLMLCSEHEPGHCHRRLVAEHLQVNWPDVEVVHL